MDVEEHLVRKLQDPDESVRIEAVELLVRNGSTRAVPALVGLLVVSDELRYHAIRALGRLHAETAAAELERLFPRATGHERLEILAALIRIGAPGLLPFLKARLKDSEAEVRRVAADGLARVAPASDLPLLVKLAQDPDWTIRNHAGWGLGRLALPQGRDALLALERAAAERWMLRSGVRGPDGEPVPLLAMSQETGAQLVVQTADGIHDIRLLARILMENLAGEARVHVEDVQRVLARGGEAYGFSFTVADEVRGRVAVVRAGDYVALAVASWPMGAPPEVVDDVDAMIGSLGPVPGALPPGVF